MGKPKKTIQSGSNMQLKQKYLVHSNIWGGQDLSDQDVEDFSVALEDLMNEYKVFRLEAVLNPYNVGVQMVVNDKKRARQVNDARKWMG